MHNQHFFPLFHMTPHYIEQRLMGLNLIYDNMFSDNR